MQDDKMNQVKNENSEPTNVTETPEEKEAREKAEADKRADEAAAAEEAEAKAKAEEDKKAQKTGKKQPVVDAKKEDLNNHEQGFGPNGGTVDIESADGKSLYAQINSQKWEGKVISVPRELEGEVRNLLEQGGFRLK